MTSAVRSDNEIILEGAAKKKLSKAEKSGIGAEATESLPVTEEADTVPELSESSQEGSNDHNLEKSFQNLIEK